MPIRRYTKDPRTAAQRHADEQVLGLVESGDFLRVKASTERIAVEAVSRGQEERRSLPPSDSVVGRHMSPARYSSDRTALVSRPSKR
jgi:hypothetical protein